MLIVNIFCIFGETKYLNMQEFNFYGFGYNLKQHRLNKQVERGGKISLRDAAKESNVSAATISRAENGKEIDIQNILKLCYWSGFKITSFIYTKDVEHETEHLTEKLASFEQNIKLHVV